MNIYGGDKLLNTHDRRQYRQIKDDEIKGLFEKIKLNTDFALPDKLVQDFINDGSIHSTLKKCTKFDNNDFHRIIIVIKKKQNVKRSPPKPSSKKKKKRKGSTKKKIKKIKKEKKKIKEIKIKEKENIKNKD